MSQLMMDPAVNLGPSIFLHILSYVPWNTILEVERVCKPWRDLVRTYEKSIWRRAAADLDATNPDLYVRELARGLPTRPAWDVPSGSGSQDRTDGQTKEEPRWRKACEDAVELDRNWRFGRCREHWITTPGDAVWRFKIDEKQGTCLSTSRKNGLHVVDVETSEKLFSMDAVHRHAHLEFVAGHAIFDIGGAASGLDVFRTSDAIAASRHPNPEPFPDDPPNYRYTRAYFPRSYTHRGWQPGSTDPLPRGHLEYYKTINPPTPCRAFRARLDRAGTPEERALLATAGETAVYIWDMEEPDPLRRETIEIEEDDQDDITYVEFDDDYVFLCRAYTVLILSRRTKRKVYEFPDYENHFRVFDWLQVPLIGHRPGSELNCKAPARVRSTVNGRKPMRQGVEVEGKVIYNGDPNLRTQLYDALQNLFDDTGVSADIFPADQFPGLPEWQFDWNACHYTRDDLVVTSLGGIIFTIRDFRSHLSIVNADERRRALADHTICTSVVYGAHLLSTTSNRMVTSAVDLIIFRCPSDLPSLYLKGFPARIEEWKKSRCQLAQTVAFGALDDGSCLQMDSRRIYVTYQAGMDESHKGDDVPADYPALGEGGEGMAIKCWDFSN